MRTVFGIGALALGFAVVAPLVAPSAAVAVERQDARASVRFVSPRRLSTVLGRSDWVLEIDAPDGRAVRSVRVTLDGRLLATLDAPPWSATWDAGPEGGDHLLEARVVFEDGSTATASTRTSRLRIDQVEEVALVTLYAIAKNESGGYVTDLAKDDFLLFENARPQQIDRFSAERRALRVAIVLDSSLSMSMNEDRIGAARDAALEFVDALEPGDEGMVATFSDKVQVLQGLTSDRQVLRDSLKLVETGGGTALYDAMWESAERLREFDGRRVLVLLSDGRDEAASGLEPGSLHTLEEALDRAIRNDVMIFVIGLGGRLARDAKRLESDPSARVSEFDFFGRTPLASILERIAETTGGRAIFSSSSGKVRKAFEEVAADLRHQYSIAYRSDDSRRDGAWREIRLTTVRPGVAVTSRSGYYAPRDRRSGTR